MNAVKKLFTKMSIIKVVAIVLLFLVFKFCNNVSQPNISFTSDTGVVVEGDILIVKAVTKDGYVLGYFNDCKECEEFNTINMNDWDIAFEEFVSPSGSDRGTDMWLLEYVQANNPDWDLHKCERFIFHTFEEGGF